MKVRIEGVISTKDHFRAIREMFHHMRFGKMLYIFLLVPSLILGVLNIINYSKWHSLDGVMCLLLSVIFLFVFLPFMHWWQVGSYRNSSPLAAGNQLFEFSETGFKIKGSLFNMDLQWASIVKVVQGRSSLFSTRATDLHNLFQII